VRETPGELEKEYAEALHEYVRQPNEAALLRAYRVGREMLTDGGGVLGIAALHHEALQAILPDLLAGSGDPVIVKRAEEVFIECLVPFEMSHRAFRDTTAALRRMNERIEEEAKRIAHALHQEAGGLLASTNLALEELARDLSPEGSGRLAMVKRLLDQMDHHLRQLAHEIRPTLLDDLGLIPALRFLAEGVSKRSGIEITVEGSSVGRLPPGVETTLYRNVQEALNNVSKHASASNVMVQVVRESNAVRCSVSDNGVGLDESLLMQVGVERGLGHVGMRERLEYLHGTLLIRSVPSEGLELVMYIPLRG
jgi:signal transduction histidine kinase